MPKGTYGYDVSGVALDATSPSPNTLALIAGAVQNGGVGFPIPPGGNPVVGIQEVDAFTTASTTTPNTVPAGALSIGFNPSSDFSGTIQGAAWTGAKGAITRTAQPGNTCPAFEITCTGGSYDLYVVTPV